MIGAAVFLQKSPQVLLDRSCHRLMISQPKPLFIHRRHGQIEYMQEFKPGEEMPVQFKDVAEHSG